MAAANAAPSVISGEVARFDALGQDWWDPAGPMAPLHRINPTRIEWLRDTIAGHFRHSGGEPPLAGLTLLDIGCGAGLLSEPLSRLGAEVTGLDPAPTSIAIARAHAEATGAKPTYRVGTVEDLVKEGRRFDVVLAMEVVEHVADVPAFVAAAASLIKPGGLFALSTLNRTFKSFALAVVGAEYVLRWLAPGTHHWEQFVTPDEMAGALRAAGLEVTQRRGMSYDPLRGEWRLSRDLAVNYFMAARRA
ncbi:MAG TPA: bifunctional 2-polyprenyl-6-hydroxyphenol methylase/3-demethylubiquinol 3-O-methyltransferase UbiG [Roseiarcus sp.]|nr:bifunctional 2-polyprenyl-6-hydroxyphenol methylase/3-demethylubiquinol 3-O-methyltransferase UbiG [Roseiarcus sp.]